MTNNSCKEEKDGEKRRICDNDTVSKKKVKQQQQQEEAQAIVHVEVVMKSNATICYTNVQSLVHEYIVTEIGQSSSFLYQIGPIEPIPIKFQSYIEKLFLSSIDTPSTTEEDDEDDWMEVECIASWDVAKVQVHVYSLSDEEAELEELETNGSNEEEEMVVCEMLPLPHVSLQGSWESIIVPPSMKRNLLQYASTALLFTQKQISSTLISWNRVLLFHGPPGTGKTTLCKACAHQLAIRHSGGYLVEIHAHSLFSKWFSESGKLIAALFTKLINAVQEEPTLLFSILVDEVESLANSRSTSKNATEPSDAIRAVNSLLTGLDRLKHYPNILIFTTTNMTQLVDSAFVDRTDLQQYMGPPTLPARYEILRSCLMELQRVSILTTTNTTIQLPKYKQHTTTTTTTEVEVLVQCAKDCQGWSGRALRKLPFQTHAMYLSQQSSITLHDFLLALQKAIRTLQSKQKQL